MEAGRDLLVGAMHTHADWFMSRIGYVETARAIDRAGGRGILPVFRDEWNRINAIEISQSLTESAAALSNRHDLKSLDAIHLASALILPTDNLAFTTWDRQLHRATRAEGLQVIPEDL